MEVRGWDIKLKAAAVGNAPAPQPEASIGIARNSLAQRVRRRQAARLGPQRRSTRARPPRSRRPRWRAVPRRSSRRRGRRSATRTIKAGGAVQLSEVGTKFSGTYPVTTVTHVMRSPDTFKTHFQVTGRSDRGLLDLMQPPAPRPWGQSMVVGIVTNNNDPDTLGRVRVKYPALSDSEEGDWARVLSHNLGKDARHLHAPQGRRRGRRRVRERRPAPAADHRLGDQRQGQDRRPRCCPTPRWASASSPRTAPSCTPRRT